LRFLKKILTDTEIEQVRSSDAQDEVLWSFWACKEAAYKVIQKQTSNATFVPRRWSVGFQTLLDSSVSLQTHKKNYRDGSVWVPGFDAVCFRLFYFSSYLHCIAADAYCAMENIVAGVERMPEQENAPGADPSVFVRLRMIHSLAAALRIPEEDLQIIRKTENGGLTPPRLYIAGVPSGMELSISHDGRYVAYAYMS
jgi:hypothetical protein